MGFHPSHPEKPTAKGNGTWENHDPPPMRILILQRNGKPSSERSVDRESPGLKRSGLLYVKGYAAVLQAFQTIKVSGLFEMDLL